MNEIIHGDALQEIKKLKSDSINLICIDPPYLTTTEKWDKKEVVNEELSKELFRILKSTGNFYCWCGIGEKSQSLIRWFPIFSKHFKFKDLLTWKKQRGMGMRKGWLYTREEIMWFVKNNAQFIWNKKEQYSNEKRPWHMTKNGKMINKSEYKRLTNVWTDIFEEGYGTSPQKYSSKKLHFAIKPVKIIERIIKLHTKKNDIVLDCFTGSGTTCIAAKNLNRRYIGIDNNKDFCEIAISRLKQT